MRYESEEAVLVDHGDMSMVIDMNDEKLKTLDQIRNFMTGTEGVGFCHQPEKDNRYQHIEDALCRLRYYSLDKADKGLVLRYLEHTTGYSRQQMTRLVRRYLDTGRLRKRYKAPVKGFRKKYTSEDLILLAETDNVHENLSGLATAHILWRQFHVYRDNRYRRLASISTSHLYNLRERPGYIGMREHWEKTRRSTVSIGERRAPAPDNRPGFIRIDSVHQGDRDGIKGVYNINAVDCVIQWEVVATCENISEAFLMPVLEQLLDEFPFTIMGFHSDNGSEYINHEVSKLLEKMRVEFTKSRPRHSGDNALAETKNGAVVRKHLGYSYIPQHLAEEVNSFCRDYLNPYLNYHRPCLFPEEIKDSKGKVRKRYPRRLVMTPLEKLLSLEDCGKYLKEGVTVESLLEKAGMCTDNEAAAELAAAKKRLFQSVSRRSRTAG